MGAGDKQVTTDHRMSQGLTASASRSMSRSECAAVNASLSRDVPAGTVGGRIATARNPWRLRSSAADKAVCAAPNMTGTIGLWARSEEHTSELQSQSNLVCR